MGERLDKLENVQFSNKKKQKTYILTAVSSSPCTADANLLYSEKKTGRLFRAHLLSQFTSLVNTDLLVSKKEGKKVPWFSEQHSSSSQSVLNSVNAPRLARALPVS